MEALEKADIQNRLTALHGWNLSSDGTVISKTYTFKDWKDAFAFATRISEAAESQNHHPDIDVHWGRVGVALSTHSAGGLSEKDFILAAKIDTLSG